MESEGLESTRDELRDTAKALMMLRSEMSQRESRMSASFNQQVQSLQQEVAKFRRDIAGIVGGASTQIAQEAKDAVAPVAAQYGRAVSATSAQLQGASRTIWMWFGAAGGILLLVLLVGWAVLGYFGRELASTKEELQRYEDAVPIVQAFYTSDVVVCDGRICSNGDPEGKRVGDQRQYRQAKPRPSR